MAQLKMLQKLFKNARTTLPTEDLIVAIESRISCISIKDQQGYYQYANQNFIHLMGHQAASAVLNHRDTDLTSNRALLKTIMQHDQYIFEESKSLAVSEELHPVGMPNLMKKVNGCLYPIFHEDDVMPKFILGIFTPKTELLALNYESIFQMSFVELQTLLIKKSYPVHFRGINLQLSRREIEIIIALLKGLHAREMADIFNLKQSTVESYLQNIKDKLGISIKSELISAVLETNLLNQILI